MLPRRLLLAAVSAVTLAAGAATSVTAASAAPPSPESAHGPSEIAPKHIFPTRGAKVGGQAKPTRSTSTGISYHGGPVLLSPQVAVIYYGSFNGSTTSASFTSIVDHFLTNLGGSTYFNINTTYTDGYGTKISNLQQYGAVDGTDRTVITPGTVPNVADPLNLSDADVRTVVFWAIQNRLRQSTNTIYVLIGSKDVNLTSGFGTQYCGWHTHGTYSGLGDVKYAAMIDPQRAPSACEAQSPGPNNDPGADGVVSIAAHEVEEATTDPDLNAWYDNRGYENADKCAWKFGVSPTGTTSNVTLGTAPNSKNYLVQQNWVNAGSGGCLISYP